MSLVLIFLFNLSFTRYSRCCLRFIRRSFFKEGIEVKIKSSLSIFHPSSKRRIGIGLAFCMIERESGIELGWTVH